MNRYTIPATEPELQALGNLIDAGVRHLGLASVEAAAAWKQKLEALQPDAEPVEEPKPQEKPDASAD